MSTRYILLTGAAILALGPLASCTTGPSTSATLPRPDLTFQTLQPLELNVGGMRVVDKSGAKQMSKNVSPVGALTKYAVRRLKAVGGQGTLNFVIHQASLTSTEVEADNTWARTFDLSNPMEYTLTMRVGLDLVGRAGQPNMSSSYTLQRKSRLPASTSLAERDAQLNVMIEQMVTTIDKSIEKGLSDSLHILVSPGAITFGQPAPIEAMRVQNATSQQPLPASNAQATGMPQHRY